jgi:hypothetical protein
MDPATASIIAAIISAVASVAVAWITTRDRIGTLPAPSPQRPRTAGPSIPVPAEQPASVRTFRAIGWGLVSLLYLMGISIVSFAGLASIHDWYYASYPQPADAPFVGIIPLLGMVFILIGYWAQRRLMRRGS